jgi:predicted acyltransferase
MKVKSTSMLIKVILIIIGFVLCVLHWCNVLPNAEIKEIWMSVAFAYGVGLGTIDFNICRDNWIEKESPGETEEA